MKLAELRQHYALESLSETDVLPHPIDQFERWFEEARNSQLLEPNAMILATADAEGRPAARTVLLKDFSAEGFTFFTNYESRKGQEMAANPKVCLLFMWLELQRQIRIEGTIEKISEAASEAYFQSRPRESQVGAWASPQSRPIAHREELEQNEKAAEARFAGLDVLPKPPHWGGYLVRPLEMEFWQGRMSRLHDRITYTLVDGQWRIGRLAP